MSGDATSRRSTQRHVSPGAETAPVQTGGHQPRRVSRRVFLGGLTAGAATALLAACGTSGEGAPATPAAGGGAPTSAPGGARRKDLVFWGRQQFLQESNEWLTQSVRLAAERGGFNVKVELFSNDEHGQKEVVAMESGVVPDITYTYAGALWHQNGYALEVPGLYDEIGRTGGGWIEFAEISSRADGKRIGIPVNNEPWSLHLRRELFEAAGARLPFKTWEEMIAAFKKVNDPSKNFFAYGGQMTNADAGGNVLPIMQAHGGRLYDKDGNPTINTPQNLAGVTAYTNLYKEKMMPPGVIQWQASGNNEAWASKQVAAVSNTGSTILAMRKSDQDLLGKTYFQAFPPAANGDKPVQAADGALLIINKKGPNTEEAMQIARMIMSPERYPTNLEKAGSYWFSVLKTYQTIPFFTNDEWNKQLAENVVPYTIPGYAEGGRNPIHDDIGVDSWNQMLQAIALQGKSPQEGLKILADNADKAKAKFKR